MVKVSSSVTIGAATVSPPVVVSVRGIVRVDAETVDVEVTVDAETVVVLANDVGDGDRWQYLGQYLLDEAGLGQH